jgi:hypothetical protein
MKVGSQALRQSGGQNGLEMTAQEVATQGSAYQRINHNIVRAPEVYRFFCRIFTAIPNNLEYL